MKKLHFEDYDEFACNIADTFNALDDEYGDVSVIARYDEAKEILKELTGTGYDICSITLEVPDYDGYDDEYILSLTSEGVWCEKFKRDTGYFSDESNVIYIMDNCSSSVLRYLYSDEMYEVNICEDTADTGYRCEDCKSCGICYDDNFYSVNGERVDKETYDRFVSRFDPDLAGTKDDMSGCDDYSITVIYNPDACEALKIIKDMDRRMIHMNDMFREIDYFRRFFY